MSDFTPGVARAQKAGHKIAVGAYPAGPAGVQISLDVIARKARDGRLDPDIKGWAGDTLIAAGRPRRIREKVGAMLDAFRKATIYLPDPVGAEYIASGAATMCLRPGLCVRARDCDDGCVFLASAVLSIGIPSRVIKQSFGPGKQEHVLIEAEDENGVWFPADPSTDLPVGEKVQAVSEVRIDPMSVAGSNGTAGAEIVTLGAVEVEIMQSTRETFYDGQRWSERRYGRWWVQEGLGWVDVGTGDACCASCASGKPCEGAGAPASPHALPPCRSCEEVAARLRASGFRGIGAVTTPTPAAPTVSFGAVVAFAAAVALAGGVGYGLARRAA